MKYFFSWVIITFLCFCLYAGTAFSQLPKDTLQEYNRDITSQNAITGFLQSDKPDYLKPKPFSFITNLPGDLLQMGKAPFQKRNLKPLIFIAASTAIFLPFDQQIINHVGIISKQIELKAEPEFDKIIPIHNKAIYKWPDNLNSAFYQLGEGTATLSLAGGLFIYGKLNHDYRALQTARDLTETFLTMGITVQALKRITGRQAPFRATAPGGKWHFFPSLSKYQNNTTNYDAFPSGHLATMMATITVLADNYPEKKWIRPIGYLLTGFTGWSMINNRVHWASDFPLGLGIGYLAGKITYWHNHKKEQQLKQVLF